MSGKGPHAAFCEEYDEDAHVILPDTRQVANITTKRSKTDLRSTPVPLVEAASDSGYSSRTAATGNSTQSLPSGRKSPVALKVNTIPRRSDLERVRTKGRDRTRDRSARPARDDKMQVGAYPVPGHPQAHVHRSPSRSQRRERTYTRHFPGTCWDCDQGLYHSTTPVEPRQVEYPYYMSPSPSVAEYPPQSPQTGRYPPSTVVQVSHSSRPQARSTRSNSYHTNRPSSYHGMMPPPMGGVQYNPSPIARYEHGPPLSSSAYANTPSYAPPPSLYSQQSSSYFGIPDTITPPEHQERSVSRPREQQPRGRRQSIFERAVDDFESSEEEEDEPVEQQPPPPPPLPGRNPRPRLPSHSTHDREEDYYHRQMPPPPPMKHRNPPHIIQKRPDLQRKPPAPPSIISDRRPSQTLELSEFRNALPDYAYRRNSRETVIPERNRSLRESRRSTAYHDSSRSARIAVENSRRRRPIVYDDDDHDVVDDDIEDKERDAEAYQASQSGRAEAYQTSQPERTAPVPVPLTRDALFKKAGSQRAESDSGSQKSRSNSSRGSDARSKNGSGVGSRADEENNNIVMMMNGVTMSFTQESVGGKRISVRTGETGEVELNIEGKRPKKYLTGGSDYTPSNASRRGGGEFDELVRRPPPRVDRKSDRASRRSRGSTYNGGY